MSTAATGGTLQIGAVAELTGLSLRTLRHYDEVGLLRPTGRSVGGFRLYTAPDVERLLLIRRMKPLRFTLEEMADLLEVVDALAGAPAEAVAGLHARLDDYVTAAEARRTELARKLEMADEFISTLRDKL
ncbi:MerR family transcriptional regulator [Cellulomonas sp. Leaf334]|uniref:helix-turn-helix domain-containing protein n=1 Tax=Cellulomonas sp. Leaf334 TaxID=1736339 RepID=UPI0006F6CCD5|nr:MerR family transcriptional regulator [Cellulomonas sp. Leaf334]KQR16241.1 MerR family transcriptional regulator [Cellulomonas sp. Leaf334]